MFGKIEFEEFEGLTKMPQKAASAWCAVDGLVGASYKPLLYIGTQTTRGINHWFIAEQTLMTAIPTKHIVTIAINEFNGVYTIVPASIETLIAYKTKGREPLTTGGFSVLRGNNLWQRKSQTKKINSRRKSTGSAWS